MKAELRTLVTIHSYEVDLCASCFLERRALQADHMRISLAYFSSSLRNRYTKQKRKAWLDLCFSVSSS